MKLLFKNGETGKNLVKPSFFCHTLDQIQSQEHHPFCDFRERGHFWHPTLVATLPDPIVGYTGTLFHLDSHTPVAIGHIIFIYNTYY
jgi:hypothetical protein